jgi:hypothetical protein
LAPFQAAAALQRYTMIGARLARMVLDVVEPIIIARSREWP